MEYQEIITKSVNGFIENLKSNAYEQAMQDLIKKNGIINPYLTEAEISKLPEECHYIGGLTRITIYGNIHEINGIQNSGNNYYNYHSIDSSIREISEHNRFYNNDENIRNQYNYILISNQYYGYYKKNNDKMVTKYLVKFLSTNPFNHIGNTYSRTQYLAYSLVMYDFYLQKELMLK